MRVFNYDDAAILRNEGFDCTDLGRDERNRIFLEFDDPDGKALEIVTRHNATGIDANSQDLLEAGTWARQRFKAANDLVPRKR